MKAIKIMPGLIAGFFLLSVILFSCNSAENDTTTNQKTETANSDTTIYLTINSVSKAYQVSKELRLNFKEFQQFLNQYPTVPAQYHDTLLIDITGDGINEQVISEIETKNGDYIIFSKILMGEKMIFCDTLKADHDLAFMDWSSDSVYFALKPYSSFYKAMAEIKIVEPLDNGKINNDLIDFYISGLEVRLKAKGMDSSRVRLMTDSVTTDLKNYHGKFVTTLDHWDRGLLVWNEKTGQLELLYEP